MDNKKESNTIDIDKILPDDLRLAKLYVMKINERETHPINTGIINSLFDYKHAIKSHIENKQKKDQEKIIRDLLRDKHFIFLEKNKFDWMKSERIIFYIWGVLKIKPFIFHSKKNKYINLPIVKLKFNESRTLSEMREDIINYIDNLPILKEGKIDILNTLKKSWYLANESFKTIFNWLNSKDKEQCEWAWEYIKSRSNVTFHLAPVTNYEHYSYTHIAFDLWDEQNETKQIFLRNIAKANNQRNFRKKSESKRCLNTYIHISSKEKLDYLTEIKKLKISEVLELLIEAEYNKLQTN